MIIMIGFSRDSFMKRLLSIFFISLLFIQTTNAAEITYLICKIKVTENRTALNLAELFEEGEVVNTLYIKLKKTKSSVKAQFSRHFAGTDWEKNKPEALYELKGKIKNDVFKFKHKFKGKTKKNKPMNTKDIYNISNNGGIWSIDGTEEFVAGDINIDYDFFGKCDLHNKKDFSKYRKKGINS